MSNQAQRGATGSIRNSIYMCNNNVLAKCTTLLWYGHTAIKNQQRKTSSDNPSPRNSSSLRVERWASLTDSTGHPSPLIIHADATSHPSSLIIHTYSTESKQTPHVTSHCSESTPTQRKPHRPQYHMRFGF